jgi:hypothetical protein
LKQTRIPFNCSNSTLLQPVHEGPLYGSGEADAGLSPEADRDLTTLDDNGNGHFPARVIEHLLQVFDVGVDIDENRPVPIGLPGLRAVRSPVRAVDDDFVFHAVTPFFLPLSISL